MKIIFDITIFKMYIYIYNFLTMEWSLVTNKITKLQGYYMFIPCFSIWYDKYRFMETGVYTPAFGVSIGWLKFNYSLVLQKL